MHIIIIRVYQGVWLMRECLLWEMNGNVGETVDDNKGRETKQYKTKNVSERAGL